MLQEDSVSVEELNVVPTPFQTFAVKHWGQWSFRFFGQKISRGQPIWMIFGTVIGGLRAHPLEIF